MLEAREFSLSIGLFIPERPAPHISMWDMVEYRIHREFGKCEEVDGDKKARELLPAAHRIVDEARSETTITITDIETDVDYRLDFDRKIKVEDNLLFIIGKNPFSSTIRKFKDSVLGRPQPQQFLGHSISVNASGYGITEDVASFQKSLTAHLCDTFGQQHLRTDYLRFEQTREESTENNLKEFRTKNRWGPHPRTWHRHAWGLKRNHLSTTTLRAQNDLLDMAAAGAPFPTWSGEDINHCGHKRTTLYILKNADDPYSFHYTPGLTQRLFRLNPNWPAQIDETMKGAPQWV